MSVSIKCPNCAAGLVFDANSQQMTCSFCGSVISAEQIAVEQNPDWKQETPSIWSNDAISYVCGNCAATVVTDQNTTATFCAFCGSPTIIPERLVQGYKPSSIIPFKYGREEAIQAFFTWCKKGRMTPNDFVSPKNIEKITGIYLPFWLYDMDAKVRFTAVGETVSRSSSGSTTTTTTKYYQVIRERNIVWERIPLDGATQVDDRLMEIVEPYIYDELIGFDMKYLAGFYAEKFDQDAKSLEPRLLSRVQKYAKCLFEDACAQYDKLTEIEDESVYPEPRAAYALMPVWMLNYTYRGKKYTFAMNGQTGKVAGDPPLSKVKIALITTGTLLTGGVLSFLIGGLFL